MPAATAGAADASAAAVSGSADAVVRHVALLCAQLLESAWFAASCNEYGALLMQQQLRTLAARLSPLAQRPHAAVARPLARLTQIVAVLGLDALPELYGLSFAPGAPLLSRTEVERLLRCRSGLVRGGDAQLGRAIEAVQWAKVRCCVNDKMT